MKFIRKNISKNIKVKSKGADGAKKCGKVLNMYPVQIYIFRHGETDWNRERRFQGHTDVPLNLKGREQALELKSHLQRLNPEIILSSDLSRALETAKIASEGMSIPIHISESLREARLGAPEGMLRDEILKKYVLKVENFKLAIFQKDLKVVSERLLEFGFLI